MKKYLYGIGLASILVLTGCTNSTTNMESSSTASTATEKKDMISETALHDAVRANDMKIVDEHIEKKMNLDVKDKYGYTPLHLAARFDMLDIAEALVDNKANVNTVDSYGDTPLIDSTRNGYTKMSKLLICNGAERSVKDKYDMTPLHYASKTNDEEITKLLKAEDLTPFCGKVEQLYNLISIDDYKVLNDNTPKICGDILDDTVETVTVTMDGSETAVDASLDKDAKRWCAQIDDALSNGMHTAVANALNTAKQKGKATDDFTVHVLDGLYDALNKEFADDFDKWNAQLDPDTLVFRFKNPELMFKVGSYELNPKYKEILNDFFPRYINIVKDYASEITSIHVEGHTSSEYASVKTVEEKFAKNEILSQNRADAVTDYVKSLEDTKVVENKEFIDRSLVSDGKSSSELVYNEDGTENLDLSRRVEFRIEANPTK